MHCTPCTIIDFIYAYFSPPEKKLRPSADIQPAHQQPESSTKFNTNGDVTTSPNVAAAVAAAVSNLNGHGHVAPSSNSGSKGGKGIRNRVFCGECTGCLKNDDCGKCRYCKDKTKFGGQNRLRQKCLHRRCQLDTHRRRSSQNTAQNAHGHPGNPNTQVTPGVNSSFSDTIAATNLSRQSPSPDTIYSGVALARLASQNLVAVDTASVSVQEKAQLSPGEIIRTSGQPVFPQATGECTTINSFYFRADSWRYLCIAISSSRSRFFKKNVLYTYMLFESGNSLKIVHLLLLCSAKT